MKDFPVFMKTKSNAISTKSQSKGVEGWVYTEANGKQMAYWICNEDLVSKQHTHDFDEYFVVVQGEYILVIDNNEITLKQGEEYHIPKGVPHAGRARSGTRTIHCFGGTRV